MKHRQRRRAAFNAGGGTNFDRLNRGQPSPPHTTRTKRFTPKRTPRQNLERDLLASLGIALYDLPRATVVLLGDAVIKVEVRQHVQGAKQPEPRTLMCEIARLKKFQRDLVARLRRMT